MPHDSNVQALKQMPGWGKFLFDAFRNVQKQLDNVGSQTNSNLQGSESSPPPAVNELRVTASGGVAHLQAVHNVPVYRGITYHFHAMPADGSTGPVTLYSGPNRDVRLPVGTAPMHYAVTCDYPTSPPSETVYHTAGGSTPAAVAATGTDQPPMPTGQGSGTGAPGQISGFGPIPWRGVNPPKRA